MTDKNYVVVPNTNIRLYEGDFVEITNHPNVKWVVHYGWFIYQNVQNHGWYFSSTKTGITFPIDTVDLTLVSLTMSKTEGSTYQDGKTVAYTRVYTDADAEALDRSFITVDTVTQRDNINYNRLPNGKLVRVNDYAGSPKYFAWNADTKSWDEVDWGSGGGDKEVLYGTTEYWDSQPRLVTIKGSVYVYSDHTTDSSGKLIPGIKIGDGISYLIDMPFIDEKYYQHILNLDIHITSEERQFWNEKVRCYIDPLNEQNIVFTTN